MGRRLTRAGSIDRAAIRGFTLIEIVCVLAVIGLLAAIILPAVPRATSRLKLQAYAVESATLLQSDRNYALRRGVRVATAIDAPGRSMRSYATGRIIQLPSDVEMDALLASRCANRPAGKTVDFFPTGLSCGGVIVLSRLGTGYEIRVNWLTGGVEIVPYRPL